MAKIIYGVQGDAHGHAVRALTLARHFTKLGHEFIFVSCNDGIKLLSQEFDTIESLNLSTKYKNYRTDILGTTLYGLKIRLRSSEQIKSLVQVIDKFEPDLAITDYEHFVPLAARKAGVPVLSLDHQHIITCCRHDMPREVLPACIMHGLSIHINFSNARDYLIISFYEPPLKTSWRAKILPPILREPVLTRKPSDQGHILVYQSCSIFKDFVPFLHSLKRRCIVYGYGLEKEDGLLSFRNYSETGLLDDLASCSYVICGGGHTLISEALYYGKPVFSLPLLSTCEQQLNALWLDRLNYGKRMDMRNLSSDQVFEFEERLEEFRGNIAAKGDFCGNEKVFNFLEEYFYKKSF